MLTRTRTHQDIGALAIRRMRDMGFTAAECLVTKTKMRRITDSRRVKALLVAQLNNHVTIYANAKDQRAHP